MELQNTLGVCASATGAEKLQTARRSGTASRPRRRRRTVDEAKLSEDEASRRDERPSPTEQEDSGGKDGRRERRSHVNALTAVTQTQVGRPGDPAGLILVKRSAHNKLQTQPRNQLAFTMPPSTQADIRQPLAIMKITRIATADAKQVTSTSSARSPTILGRDNPRQRGTCSAPAFTGRCSITD